MLLYSLLSKHWSNFMAGVRCEMRYYCWQKASTDGLMPKIQRILMKSSPGGIGQFRSETSSYTLFTALLRWNRLISQSGQGGSDTGNVVIKRSSKHFANVGLLISSVLKWTTFCWALSFQPRQEIKYCRRRWIMNYFSIFGPKLS